MDKLDQPLMLAIGYHKTGTTWRERHLWSDTDLGFCLFKGRDLRDIIVGPAPFDFDLERCRDQLRASWRDVGEGVMPVFGMERLSGSPYSGGHDSKEIADRLVRLFPNAKILIVIREQTDMILSTYNQSVLTGNTSKLKDYISSNLQGRYALPGFDMRAFRYHRLINYYVSLFGRANVLTLPYEMFRDSAGTFIERIIEFSGVQRECPSIDGMSERERASLKPMSVAMLRMFNLLVAEPSRFNRHAMLPLGLNRKRMGAVLHRIERQSPAWVVRRNKSAKQALLDQIAQQTSGQYEQSNALLVNDYGLDLARYGYALPPVEPAP